MNIDLLSKMVAELILDNDEVSLPGLGVFVAEMVPASFSDKGYTINPPYRRLSFRQKPENDTLLVGLYAETNRLTPKDAASILGRFLAELKEILIEKKTVVFPGLGRLRATKENNFFFVPDENLNIYPEGFWMQSLSLKTHEETEEEIASAVESLGDMLTASIVAQPEPEVEETPVTEPEPEPVVEPEPEPVVEETPVTEPEPVVEPQPMPEPVVEETPVTEPEPEPVVEKEPEPAVEKEPLPVVKPVADPEPEPKPVRPTPKKKKKPMPRWARTLVAATLATIGTAAAALVLFVAVSRINPGSTDKILYSAEELEILNYPLD